MKTKRKFTATVRRRTPRSLKIEAPAEPSTQRKPDSTHALVCWRCNAIAYYDKRFAMLLADLERAEVEGKKVADVALPTHRGCGQVMGLIQLIPGEPFDPEAFEGMTEVRYSAEFETIYSVDPLLMGQARIGVGPADIPVNDEEWMYGSLPEALQAFHLWNPAEQKEPDGWTRHMPSGRRRPDGDAEREYVEK